MNHKGCVYAFEGTRTGHEFLTTAPLLCGCAEQFHTPGQERSDDVKGESRPQCRRGNNVVTAGMPNLRQCIIFSEHGHGWASLLGVNCRLKGGL